jgi:hypothetical protein
MAKGHSESDAYHMAVGLIHSWAAGHDGHGHKTHPDVRAAAAANLAKWEETRAKAHAETAARHLKHASRAQHSLAASADLEAIADALLMGLASGPTYYYPASMMKNGTAPGAQPLVGHQLQQRPSQTVAAGPPLPPGVSLPTPEELDKLGSDISGSGVPGSDVVRGAAKHAHAAAEKMRASQPIDALSCLRSCQTGIRSAHREFNASQIPIANVFSAKLAPAEAASARAEMFQGLSTRNEFRALASRCAQHIDRIRRAYYHGQYNHLAEARFTQSGVLDLLISRSLAYGNEPG